MLKNFPPIIHALGITFFWVCTVFTGFGQTSFDHIKRFSGNWISHDGFTLERWNLERDRILSGEGFKILNNDTSLTEHLGIFYLDGKRIFSARVLNQNEGETVLFNETRNTKKNRITFYNPNHDFPKRLEYRFKGTEKMVVKVSGDSGSFKIRFRKLHLK